MADRNFPTQELMRSIVERNAAFLFRRHGQLRIERISQRLSCGRCSTGQLWEYDVRLTNGMEYRALEIQRDQPLEDGTYQLILLTSVPRSSASANELAELYLTRWTIEEAFRQLTQYLSCEVRTLGYPRAALLAFSLAVMAYNCLSCMRGALASEHGRERVETELSAYHMALEVASVSDGLDVAVPPAEWAPLENLSLKKFAQVLRQIARGVNLTRYAKSPRGPKSPSNARK